MVFWILGTHEKASQKTKAWLTKTSKNSQDLDLVLVFEPKFYWLKHLIILI